MAYTEIRKTMIPNTNKGVPFSTATPREYIYFTVQFNNFRDVSGSHANEVTDREEFDTCECVICLPETYTDDGDETPLIISCHGSGELVNEEKCMVGGVQRLMNCVDAGYAVMDVNGSAPHGRTMGCPEHVCALFKAYKYVTKKYNLSKQVMVVGASMGGGSAMNFATTYPSLVLALGLIFPRLNVEGAYVGDHYCIGAWDKNEIHPDTGSCAKERTATAFRFPKGTEEWCDDNMMGFDPYRTRSFINKDGERCVIPPCPVKIWHGNADSVIDVEMSREYVRSVRRAGCYIEYHEIDGIGHKVQPAMQAEILMWFNRFV